jgi:cation:H+ antiporter
MRLLRAPSIFPLLAAILLFAAPLRETGPSTILWTAPAILISAMIIAWAAESSQYFIAQGFALAILAWLQTLPEFAVEAVLAWKQQVPLLLAALTGALRLLTGFGWPVIYFTASLAHRRRHGAPLRAIVLARHHSVEVVGLLAPLAYIAVVAVKATLTIFDAILLTLLYAAYLAILSRLPAEGHESVDELATIPRAIVKSPRAKRIALIALLFAAGAALIYFSAEPFLASLLAISTLAGIPNFVFIQWVAPIVSEFPEMASTIYFARATDRAPMALMNMVSSNINQWTLLMAMLPVLYSISAGAASAIPFDAQQQLQLWLTLAQALVGLTFLINMELVWWEALLLFVLFLIPFAIPAASRAVTIAYFAWTALELVRILTGQRKPLAFARFVETWKSFVAAPRSR